MKEIICKIKGFEKIPFVALGIILMLLSIYLLSEFNVAIVAGIIIILSAAIGTYIFRQTENPWNNFIVGVSASVLYVISTLYKDILELGAEKRNYLIIAFLVSFAGINLSCIMYKFSYTSVKEYKKYLKFSSIYFILAYIVLLADLLFFSGRNIQYEGAINLTPFKTITLYIVNGDYVGYKAMMANLVGNIILFIPFGFVSYIFIKEKIRVFMYLLMLPVLIEIIQFMTGTGISDIDDIILNFSGGLIGLVIHIFLEKLYVMKHKSKENLLFEIK